MARNYILRGGKYEGVYQIYNDVEEFQAKLSGVPYLTWSVCNPSEIATGGYIEAEDGFVLPILHVRCFIHPVYKRETYFVRFPMGTFMVWRLVSGKFRWSRFYAMYTVNDKSSGSQLQYTTHRGVDKLKQRFGILIAGGMKPVQAYLLAFGVDPNRYTPGHLSNKATNLLREDIVMEEIRTTLQPFQDSINKRWSNEKLLEMMESHDINVKPGTATYQKWMEFIMELRGLISSSKSKAALNVKDPDSVPDASYSEVPANQIGPPLSH